MLYSMTAFASKTFVFQAPSGDSTTISITIKTLNSRFFETTVKIPHTLSCLENECIKQFKDVLKRGHVYCTIYISNQTLFEGSITPAMATINNYISAINHIKKTHHLTEPVTLENILRLPNIFSQEPQPLEESTKNQILSIIKELINEVVTQRRVEGAALQDDIVSRVAIIKNQMVLITDRAAIVLQEKKAKIHATLQEIDPQDQNLLINTQKSSLYSLLDKIDIHEEIIRLQNHLEQLIIHINSPDTEKGKRLDFILQELAREINTITAKCSDSIISLSAINVKVEIEKIREQIQNII